MLFLPCVFVHCDIELVMSPCLKTEEHSPCILRGQMDILANAVHART